MGDFSILCVIRLLFCYQLFVRKKLKARIEYFGAETTTVFLDLLYGMIDGPEKEGLVKQVNYFKKVAYLEIEKSNKI